MTKDEAILEFIGLARTHICEQDIDPNMEYNIKRNFDSIVEAVVVCYKHEMIPKLIICNTYNKYSSILPIKKSKDSCDYYLLYDIHLYELNKLLNTFFLSSDENVGHDIWKFAYELFEEESALSKDEMMITYYGLNKIALGPYAMEIDECDEADFILDVQEKYILAHEVGHWIFEMIQQKENQKFINLADLEVVLEDIKVLLCEVYEQYEGIFQEKDYMGFIDEQKKIVHNNSRIVEECFADAIAYSYVFDFINKVYENSLEKKLCAGKALLLIMSNLQLLAIHHMTVSDESFENATSIRLAFFRNYTELYFENEEKTYSEMLEGVVFRYESRITNLILECFSELEDRRENIYNAIH